MERDSLILYAKIEALFFQVYPTFKNYPRAEHHALCSQIKQCFVGLLEKVGVAKEVPSRRRQALQEAAAPVASASCATLACGLDISASPTANASS